MDKPGLLYVITCEMGIYKVGVTTRLRRRISQLAHKHSIKPTPLFGIWHFHYHEALASERRVKTYFRADRLRSPDGQPTDWYTLGDYELKWLRGEKARIEEQHRERGLRLPASIWAYVRDDGIEVILKPTRLWT